MSQAGRAVCLACVPPCLPAGPPARRPVPARAAAHLPTCCRSAGLPQATPSWWSPPTARLVGGVCVGGGWGGGGGGAGVEQASAVLSFGPAPLEVLTALMDNVGAGAGGAEPIAVVGCSPTWRATTVAPPTAGSPLQRKAVQPRRQAPAGAACSPPPVLCSSFSRLLVLAVPRSSPQPKVFNRDGKELGELPKGDMYIRDLKNTKGA